MSFSAPEHYYNRFDPAKNFEQHLFRAGYVMQSAEFNEVQSISQHRLQRITDTLFKDGDVINGAEVEINADIGAVTISAGAIYLRGAVRDVAAGSLSVPLTGDATLGVYLLETVITELEDPTLRDPAIGMRNYQEAGAARLRLDLSWGVAGDGTSGSFFPVYSVKDGALVPKSLPPGIDAIKQAIATYDKDNSGGNYVVSGYRVTAMSEPEPGVQAFSISTGRARIDGFAIEHRVDTRINRAVTADLRRINAEPHLVTDSAQTINFDRTPVKGIASVQVTREKTVSITRGMVSGGTDNLPDSSVLQLVAVSQGGTTYTIDAEVQLTSGKVDWSLPGGEPSGGSTYDVTYQYISTEYPAPEDWDETTLTINGAVVGTLLLITYDAAIPRFDRLCVDGDGLFVWLTGTPDDYNPVVPSVPNGMLGLATIHQSWFAGSVPYVSNDAVRVVNMDEIQAINSRLDLMTDLLARHQLATDTSLREASLKRGILVDPFTDQNARDLGVEQTAAVTEGILSLPIETDVENLAGSNQVPNVLTVSSQTAILKQEMRTGGIKINAYTSIAPVPANVRLDPAKDNWTETKVVNTSSTSVQNITTSSSNSVRVGVNYWYGYGSYNTYVGSTSSTSRSTSSSSNTTTTNRFLNEIEHLRPIDVEFSISGFDSLEELSQITFDGVTITPSAV